MPSTSGADTDGLRPEWRTVLTALASQPCSTEVIAERTGITCARARQVLRQLDENNGWVHQNRPGNWEITPAGVIAARQ